jgi:hypothetical protein
MKLRSPIYEITIRLQKRVNFLRKSNLIILNKYKKPNRCPFLAVANLEVLRFSTEARLG